jgi:hypothetical protein
MFINEILKNKPDILWHTSEFLTDILIPGKDVYTRYKKFKGDFLFATSKELETYMYVLHGDFVLNSTGYPDTMICIISDRDKLVLPYENNKDLPLDDKRRNYKSPLINIRYIYEIPSDTFVPVTNDEQFHNEWISEVSVKVKKIKQTIYSVDEVLEKNLQVFFCKNPEEIYTISDLVYKEVTFDSKIKKLIELADKRTGNL